MWNCRSHPKPFCSTWSLAWAFYLPLFGSFLYSYSPSSHLRPFSFCSFCASGLEFEGLFWKSWKNVNNSIFSLKRTENISRSPLFDHITVSLDGLSTIHAFGQNQRFFEGFKNKLDENSSAMFMFNSGKIVKVFNYSMLNIFSNALASSLAWSSGCGHFILRVVLNRSSCRQNRAVGRRSCFGICFTNEWSLSVCCSISNWTWVKIDCRRTCSILLQGKRLTT